MLFRSRICTSGEERLLLLGILIVVFRFAIICDPTVIVVLIVVDALGSLRAATAAVADTDDYDGADS